MQIFYCNFSDYQALPECPLSQYRRSKLSKITNKDKFKKEIITEFFLMKCLLSVNGNLQRPLNIQINEYGKPYIPSSGICFSVSHSDDLLVVAIDTNDIGIDCENSESVHNYTKIAERFFTEHEIKYIQNYDQFLEIWTKKEAYAKMLGIPLINILGTDLTGLKNTVHLKKDTYHITICSST